MKSKKKGHHVRRSPNFDLNLDTEQKKCQNDNALILGRVSINIRPTRHIPSADVLTHCVAFLKNVGHVHAIILHASLLFVIDF